MPIAELILKLESADYRQDAIARIIGYVILIQRKGWDGLKLVRQSRQGLRKTFKSLGVEPESVVF